MNEWNTDDTGLKVIDASDFERMQIPPRKLLLAPWLMSESLIMIHAQTGVGKTHLTLNIAHSLATAGEFLGWQAPEPVTVLYIDGEMAKDDLQTRLKAITARTGKQPDKGQLRILARSMQFDGCMPNLFSEKGQSTFGTYFKDVDVIIIDNLSSLVSGSNENEAEGWEPIQSWAVQMRTQGKTIIFVHHAGKNGTQRGTSKRTDLMDIVIKLERRDDYIQEEGAHFRVLFEKARSLYGPSVAPFEAKLVHAETGVQTWERIAVGNDAEILEMLELLETGLTQTEVAEKLGVNKSKVSRALKRTKLKQSERRPQLQVASA
jgi:predicted ATP-dependent serine protease